MIELLAQAAAAAQANATASHMGLVDSLSRLTPAAQFASAIATILLAIFAGIQIREIRKQVIENRHFEAIKVHSREIKDFLEEWKNKIKDVSPTKSPRGAEPKKLPIDVLVAPDKKPLFEDLKNHSQIKPLLNKWSEYLDELFKYESHKYQLYSEIEKKVVEETGLPIERDAFPRLSENYPLKLYYECINKFRSDVKPSTLSFEISENGHLSGNGATLAYCGDAAKCEELIDIYKRLVEEICQAYPKLFSKILDMEGKVANTYKEVSEEMDKIALIPFIWGECDFVKVDGSWWKLWG